MDVSSCSINDHTIYFQHTMARGIEGNEIATPRPKPTLVKQASSQSGKQQKTLLGFFQKKDTSRSPAVASSDVADQVVSSPVFASSPVPEGNKENGM